MLMTFSDWRAWVRDLPISIRWFVFLVLLRPIIDNFYYLKEFSPFLSPNYIVGVLTPFFAIYAAVVMKKPNYSRLDTYMGIFSLITGISCAALLVSDAFSLDAIEFSLKMGFMCYMYFFTRTLIHSKRDLYGVLQSFIYSTIFVVLSFGYEIVFQPINVQISRGFERFQGNFSDVMNYAIYMSVGLLIFCYAFLVKDSPATATKKTSLLAFAFIVSVAILFNIHHTASYAVVGFIMILFLFYNFRRNAIFGLAFIGMAAGMIYFLGQDAIDEKVMPLIETDIKVYEGEKDNDMLFHGRVGRWNSFLDYFFEKNTFVQFFGLPLSLNVPYMYISKGSHNDFIRILMSIGFIGLFLYIMLLLNVGVRLLRYSMSMQFLGVGALAIIALYSISTTPLLYPPLMYVFILIMCMLALPVEAMKEKNEQ